MSSRIVLKDITKIYGNNHNKVFALKDINMDILPGEFCAIMGSSGCGKSTIVNIIAGFILPSYGSCTVDDVVVTSPNSDRVVVAQNYSLFDWKTVYENIEFGLKAQKIPKVQRKVLVDKYLNLVHLTKFAHRYPRELSGGMRQRVALARALAVKPKCLLLDEPLAALDVEMRQSLQDEIMGIWSKTKQTVVLVTHDLEEALYLSDKLILMGANPGNIRESIMIPFPRPRLPELRFSDKFQKFKRQIHKQVYERY